MSTPPFPCPPPCSLPNALFPRSLASHSSGGILPKSILSLRTLSKKRTLMNVKMDKEARLGNLVVDDVLRQLAPGLVLGVVEASVQVRDKSEDLWKALQEEAERQKKSLVDMNGLVAAPEIVAAREVFKACGKKPQKYRVSSEALLRRVLQGKSLYQVNNLVDINNLVSLHTRCSVGTYDLDRLREPLHFSVGEVGESYEAIGKTVTEVADLPVFRDAEGPYGSPWSDSVRAMIRPETCRAGLAIIAFLEVSPLEESVEYAAEQLKRFAGASDVSTSIVGR